MPHPIGVFVLQLKFRGPCYVMYVLTFTLFIFYICSLRDLDLCVIDNFLSVTATLPLIHKAVMLLKV